jgi:outer membrane protein assembly factor BamE (lipoprotein component of BamABCDE complex)
MIRNRRVVIVCTVCALTTAIAACTTTSGRKVDISGVRQIREGVTSKADVERLIGSPYSTNRLVDGSEQWLWTYSEMTSAGMYSYMGLIGSKGSSTAVTITFKNDIVAKCRFSTSSAEGQHLEGMYAAMGQGYGAGGNSSESKCSEAGR